MALYVTPAAFALAVWWFSTGVIVYLNNLPPRTFRWSMAGGSLIAAAALYRLHVSSGLATPAAAYTAFTCGVLVWGWHEMAFFMGLLTGPRRTACPHGCGGWAHFGHGIQACLDHELAIIISAVAVLWATLGAPNQVGLWTFMILWGMRQSAKLNVFLGVRNLNEEFLPAHLMFLKSFMKRRPMNALFPVSIVLGTWITAILVAHAGEAQTRFQSVGLTFLITMLALGVIEHWFLVLPLPFARIWGWWLQQQGRTPTHAIVHEHRPHACSGDQDPQPAVA